MHHLDWLSRLLDLIPIQGHLDLRCLYGAPWRISQESAAPGEIDYHIVVSGSAVLDDPKGGPPLQLLAGDILLFPHGAAHVLHDGSGVAPAPAQERPQLNLMISENAGTGGRLDLLCGRFVLTPQHDRLLRDYLPPKLIVRKVQTAESAAQDGRAGHLASLVELMRAEAALESLGGRAMLNALSTAMFALILRVASEADDPAPGMLALAGNPRLAPALLALFRDPGRAWTLPELARLCHMSRATLARQFQQRLGRSASDLLADIRMTLAAKELRSSAASTAAVAERVGYASEAAFQRVFTRRIGMTPAQWRRTGRARD